MTKIVANLGTRAAEAAQDASLPGGAWTNIDRVGSVYSCSGGRDVGGPGIYLTFALGGDNGEVLSIGGKALSSIKLSDDPYDPEWKFKLGSQARFTGTAAIAHDDNGEPYLRKA